MQQVKRSFSFGLLWASVFYLNACNFQGDASNIEGGFTPGLNPTGLNSQGPNYAWDFSTTASYDFDPGKISVKGGVCSLASNQTDFSSDGFTGGASYGVAWDSTHDYLRLGNNGGCDSSSLACANQIVPSIYQMNANTPHSADLVDYWTFEGSGSIDNGISIPHKVGFDGTSSNNDHAGMAYVSGQVGNGIYFDGSDDSIITGDTSFNPGTGSFSVSTWVKTTTAVHFPMVVKRGSCGHDNFWGLGLDYHNAGKVYFEFDGDGSGTNYDYFESNNTVNDGAWHFVVMTRAALKITIYIDGVYDNEKNIVDNTHNVSFNSANPINIRSDGGCGPGGSGTLDEVAIWNAELSASDISEIYANQAVKHSGILTSRVMDSLQSGLTWTSLSWVSTLPFFKELTSTSETTASYPLQSANLMGAGAGSSGGIVGLWHLDELSASTTATDSSGNGNTATQSAVNTLGAHGKFGNAASFIGTNYLTTLHNSFPTGAMARTLSGWVNFNGDYTTNNRIWAFGAAGANSLFGFYVDANAPHHLFVWVSGGDIDTGAVMPINTWVHLAETYDGTKLRTYLNGSKRSETTIALNTATGGLGIGASNTGTDPFHGSIDELGLWSRALTDGMSSTPNEILELYRRGSNRIKYQVRTCSTANVGLTDCTDDPNGLHWKGPDGIQTYFSELNNSAMSSPLITFANFTGFASYSDVTASQRYFQYRMILESDDTASNCDYGSGANSADCSPELKSVSVGPDHYDFNSPSVVGKIGVNVNSLTNFTQTLGSSCTSGIGYNLGLGSNYATAVWYWWDTTLHAGAGGWTPVTSGNVSQSNSAAVIAAHSGAFGTQAGVGTVYFKAYLKSTGESACSLDQLVLNFKI